MNDWPVVRLEKVLLPVNRIEPVNPVREYRLLGVRLDGHGPFIRETIQGSQSAAKMLYRVTAGDFIYSRLFACRGAFGIVEPELDGCHVSGEFPTFRPVDDRIDIRFLRHWFRLAHTLDRVNEDCSGSTPLTRNRFKEQFFLALELPLPSIPEQRRIVTRIEELAAKVAEAQGLKEKVSDDLDRLLICMAHRQDLSDKDKLQKGWRQVLMHSLGEFTDDSVKVEGCERYPNLGIYSYGRGTFHKADIAGATTSAKTLRRVHASQFIYSRLFAFEGAYAMVTSDFDGYFVSQEYPTFTCNSGLACAEFLWAHFRHPSVWQALAAGSKGLGHRRQRVQPARLFEYRLWVPPLDAQHEIQVVQSKVNALRHLQSETAAELDALMPSILDKAFKGEL
jgi:type I restriction enzyme, S subunit